MQLELRFQFQYTIRFEEQLRPDFTGSAATARARLSAARRAPDSARSSRRAGYKGTPKNRRVGWKI